MINVVTRQEQTVRSLGKPRHNYPKAKAFALAAAVMIAIWLAPRPAAAQVINACVNNKTGALRIANTCKKTEHSLTFNQVGPAGPTGPSGAMGVAGPAGPTGPAGQLAPVANVQQLNLVNGSNTVLASLGTTSDGNVLTFFDSSGKKTLTLGNSADGTFAGMATWDGNSIFPGTGTFRSSFGESNASNFTGGGFGFAIFDPSSKVRATGGTTADLTQGFFQTIDPNGSIAGIIDDDKTFHQQGFFANDLNGKNRVFAGNTLDGTTYTELVTVDPNGSVTGIEDDNFGGGNQGFFASDLNGKVRVFAGNSLDATTFEQFSFSDSKGNFAGLLGFNSSLTGAASLGSSLVLADPSGTFFAGEDSDGAGVNWTLLDTSSTVRAFGNFDGSNEDVELFSPSSVLVGHLP